MNYKPIIIVAGEPFSIFIEIFFKALKKNRFKHPIVLIVSKNLMIKQMKKLKINHKFFLINKNNFDLAKLNNSRTYIIDVDFSFKKPFEKITNTGVLLPVLFQECKDGFESSKNPTDIIDQFFKKHTG